VVRTEVAVRRELGGVGLGPAQVRGVPPVEQTMRHKRAGCAIGASCPHMGYKLYALQLIYFQDLGKISCFVGLRVHESLNLLFIGSIYRKYL
jgi:hypothetical protein